MLYRYTLLNSIDLKTFIKNHTIFISVFLILFATSCSLDDNGDNVSEVTVTHWNLINVTGGIAGVDIDYEIGDITWDFDEINRQVLVKNSIGTASESSLPSGIYTYFVIQHENSLYITIDGEEYGELTRSFDDFSLTINQNNQSSGTISDGFIYSFKKTSETIKIGS